MDLLSIFLKLCCIVLIIVFIIVGIKLVILLDNINLITKDIQSDIENYKNKLSPVIKCYDYFVSIVQKFINCFKSK